MEAALLCVSVRNSSLDFLIRFYFEFLCAGSLRQWSTGQELDLRTRHKEPRQGAESIEVRATYVAVTLTPLHSSYDASGHLYSPEASRHEA